MLTDADRQKAADSLIKAENDREPVLQLSTTWPDITFEDAYAIQNAVTARKVADGSKVIGHKVGLTSKAMQRSSQIDEPDYGHLMDYMMIADGARVPHADYCIPRVELELAFVLGDQLKGPGIGLLDVLRATEYMSYRPLRLSTPASRTRARYSIRSPTMARRPASCLAAIPLTRTR